MNDLYLGEKIKDTSEYEKLLKTIKEFYIVNKFWPTVAELGRLLNWCKRSVIHRITILEREGYIYKEGYIRNIRLNENCNH